MNDPDRLNALVQKSWMYRALKMETEIEHLRKEIDGLRQYHRNSTERIFDRLHDISVHVGVGGDGIANVHGAIDPTLLGDPDWKRRLVQNFYDQISNTRLRVGDTVRFDVTVT